jgi:hypothetical protein
MAPNPRHLLLVSAAIVVAMVSLTPVGSSDTASYAAYGHIAAQGGDPYTTNPQAAPGPENDDRQRDENGNGRGIARPARGRSRAGHVECSRSRR